MEKYKVSINRNCFNNGLPILSIRSLSGKLCKHRNIRLCPLYFSSFETEIRKYENRIEEFRKKKRNYGIFCLVLIVFATFVYLDSISRSIKDFRYQNDRYRSYIDDLQHKNYFIIYNLVGSDDDKE